MSSGGLMQLVAYGAQDIYLTGDPETVFRRVVDSVINRRFFKSKYLPKNENKEKYKEITDNLQNKECCICLENCADIVSSTCNEFTIACTVPNSGEFIKLLCCGHIFHDKCIEQWMEQSTYHSSNFNKCPLCRAYIKNGSFNWDDSSYDEFSDY
jgi:hypothetical protein